MRSSLRPLMIFALIGTAAAVPAWAQSSADSGPSPYPACTSKPTQADTDAAHGAYMAGKGSFDEADYTTAVNYFRDAYRRDCTKHELLVIIARAYELQGQRSKAAQALQTYLDRVPNAPDAEVQRRHIANLQKEIADSASASASASAPPPASASASASVAPPSSASVAPAVSTAPTSTPTSEPRSHSAIPWVIVGVGGAALITGGILYGVGAGGVSSAESACGSNHVCPAGNTSAVSQGNSGRTDETIGVVLGSVGLAAVAGGLIWHFAEPTGTEKTGRFLVTPQVGPGYAGAGVTGRF